ncbi:MAG TPA: adenosylcobinamide-GDP ribazoletransferase [Candidatus Angelobacter sp.]|nr:adenosylcobinamide-GDP ribazoletransferase [Candidatus Angelobacter sp.]
MRIVRDLGLAFQFLTRLPIPGNHHEKTSISQAAVYFPLVGLVVGAGAAALHRILGGRVNASVMAVVVLVYLVLITGGLHEDGLADVADGFGGGWTKERILEIMRDSRVGAFGALAIALSALARYSLLSSLADDARVVSPAGFSILGSHTPSRFAAYVIAAHVLCRWTTLPLAYFLPAARTSGQGASVARQISSTSVLLGTILAVAICYFFLRSALLVPLAVTLAVTLLSGLYYRRRIGGVTGDCFGATNQVAEIAVYFCGAIGP